MILQPQDLRNLHLQRHRIANIAQHLVFRGVDQVRFPCSAVVQPQDHVAISVEVWTGDGDRAVGFGREDGERAGSVEADAVDFCGGDVLLGEGLADCGADALPDVGG